jgi:cytidylate kinase
MKVAISGPAASGKGTIARSFAVEAKIGYVDLGLIFRLGAFALGLKRIDHLADLLGLITNRHIVYVWTEGSAKIFWRGEDITNQLLSQDIARQTSALASDSHQQERLIAIANFVLEGFDEVVCDGRNAGTVILSDADYKFFITARLEERARRRYLDIIKRDEDVTYEDVLREIRYRDKQDIERNTNPLVVPKGATIIETDNQTVEQSVSLIWEEIRLSI